MKKLTLLLCVLLLPAVGMGQGDMPEKPVTNYTYVNAVSLLVTVGEEVADSPEVYGSADMYESIVLNQLNRNDVEVLTLEDQLTADTSWANEVLLWFYLNVLELSNSTGKTGQVVWTVRLKVLESMSPDRWSVTGKHRAPNILSTVYTDGVQGFAPDKWDIKGNYKEKISEWVEQFVADLRRDNSPGTLAKLERYWEYQDSIAGN